MECDPRIIAAAAGVVDIGGREIDADDSVDARVFSEREAQVAGAAADIQHAVAARHTCERDETWRQNAAPSAHLYLVASAIRRNEGRRGCHVSSSEMFE